MLTPDIPQDRTVAIGDPDDLAFWEKYFGLQPGVMIPAPKTLRYENHFLLPVAQWRLLVWEDPVC